MAEIQFATETIENNTIAPVENSDRKMDVWLNYLFHEVERHETVESFIDSQWPLLFHGSPNPNVVFSDGSIDFTDNNITAENFSKAIGRGGLLPGEKSTIYERHVKFLNPKIIVTEEEYEMLFDTANCTSDVIKDMIERGFDWVIYQPSDENETYYKAFSTKQLKTEDELRKIYFSLKEPTVNIKPESIVKISPKTIAYKTVDLNPFSGNAIEFQGKTVWAILMNKEPGFIYIDRIEIDKEFRGRWLTTKIISGIFDSENIEMIKISSTNEAATFWASIGAKDLWRAALLWDRQMTISKQDFFDISSGKKKPYERETFFDKPYDQSKETEETLESWESHIYRTIWEENRLPLGMKLYRVNPKDYEWYFEVGEEKNIFSILDNGKESIIPPEDLRVTRYSNAKYEEGNWDWCKSKEEFASKNFDAMVNGDLIMLYKSIEK